jgi:SIR2-like domain
MTLPSHATIDERSDLGDRSSPARLIAEAVKTGRCILFLGAGVHYPPPGESRFAYPEAERPPLGATLARKLAADCDFARVCPDDEPTNLMRVSLCYQTQRSRRGLVEEIRRSVEENAKPSAAVRGLAELPFPLVITTNYDTLFERALRRADKDPLIGTYEPSNDIPTRDLPPDRELTAQRPFVFKVHGDVNVPDSIVVTDEDYISFVLRMNAAGRFHPIPETFRYQLQRWPTLFIGYSLLDYNLRLLFRTLRWRVDESEHPDSYSVDLRPDPLISQVWQRDQGFRFIAEDVWDFVPRLYQEVLGKEMPA